jgi:hypothetical protein
VGTTSPFLRPLAWQGEERIIAGLLPTTSPCLAWQNESHVVDWEELVDVIEVESDESSEDCDEASDQSEPSEAEVGGARVEPYSAWQGAGFRSTS